MTFGSGLEIKGDQVGRLSFIAFSNTDQVFFISPCYIPIRVDWKNQVQQVQKVNVGSCK